MSTLQRVGGVIPTVGHGCPLCVADGGLLVCTERCDETTPAAVHYLTRRVLIACQPQRKDLEGAPLNTTDPAQVTCAACLQLLAT